MDNRLMIDAKDEARLRRLVDVFLAENAKLNLSAFRTQEQCWIGNVLDSLAFLDIAPKVLGKDWLKRPIRLVDVGTGGGFPLLPIAIAMPNARCVGIDATRKKVDAARRIIDAMHMQNVELFCRRIEEFAREPRHRACFDVAVARAVAPIGVLLEYMIPLLKVRGRCVLWKSKHIAEELRASASVAKALGATIADQHAYTLPGDWGERQFLIFEKTGPTPGEFPRGVGLPKGRPLSQ